MPDIGDSQAFLREEEGVANEPPDSATPRDAPTTSVNWWASKGFLTDPCATLVATFPTMPVVASTACKDLLAA